MKRKNANGKCSSCLTFAMALNECRKYLAQSGCVMALTSAYLGVFATAATIHVPQRERKALQKSALNPIRIGEKVLERSERHKVNKIKPMLFPCRRFAGARCAIFDGIAFNGCSWWWCRVASFIHVASGIRVLSNVVNGDVDAFIPHFLSLFLCVHGARHFCRRIEK